MVCFAHSFQTAVYQDEKNLQKFSEIHFQICRNNETLVALFRRRFLTWIQLSSIFSQVHLKVSADFYDEITRLEAIIDRFNERFEDNPKSIAAYKQVYFIYL